MKEVLPGRALWAVAVCWVFGFVLLGAGSLHAQAAPLGPEGLDGGRFVGSARLTPKSDTLRAFRGAFSLGYAHTEAVLGTDDHHERIFSEFAGAFARLNWLQLALKLDGRYDIHRSKSLGNDSGFAGSTELTTRHAFAVGSKFSLAGQTRFRFPGANATKLGFSGVSSELSALASWAAWEGGELSGVFGYRFDRSAHALKNPDTLSQADQLGASVSRYNAVLAGAMLTAQLRRFTVVGEWSWDVNVGAGAPTPMQSPMRLRGALQTVVGERWVPGAEIGFGLSSRPQFNDLIRIEPRFWAAFTLGILLGKKPAPEPTEQPLDRATEEQPKVAAKGELVVLVTDADAPMAGAAVTVTMGEETLSAETDAGGRARFRVVRGEALDIEVTAQGCKPASQRVVLEQAHLELPVPVERSLPEGEIKGKVRSLRGGPLKAQVEILTTGQVLQTADDGTFLIDVPPGDYRLRISAEGHETQERSAQVERLGVTILVVDLRRTRK
ncbi:MAG: carboxypeptidase-like regulatory domain-containing protein [Myxococcales bacterium]